MKALNAQDASFLTMESLRTPMHISALMIFKLPESTGSEFLRALINQLRTEPFMPAPFDCRIQKSWLPGSLPRWVKTDYDMDYHVRHSALPKPGGERELGILVSRLHSHPLDMSRPLWEAHVIEGLENRRFAIFFKAHHCAVDGMGAMALVKSWLSTDRTVLSGPQAQVFKPYVPTARRPKDAAWKRLLEQTKTLGELGQAFKTLSDGSESTIKASQATPKSLFNVPVSQQRRLGTQLLALSRFKAISKATKATVNDVALAVIAGSMRRYLLEKNALPSKPLTASIPIGLPRTDSKPGNAVAGFVAPLGTDIADPVERVRRINAVTGKTKEQLLSLSSNALEQFTMIGMSPLILGQMTGLLAKAPPFFNVVVSNVVASKDTLYLMGAELEAMYPISVLFDGYALNVTIVGYAEHIALGFTGCRNAIPQLQKLAVYAGDALRELELACNLPGAAAPAAVAQPPTASEPAPVAAAAVVVAKVVAPAKVAAVAKAKTAKVKPSKQATAPKAAAKPAKRAPAAAKAPKAPKPTQSNG